MKPSTRIPILTLYFQSFEYDWPRFKHWYHQHPPDKPLPPTDLGGRSAALSTPKIKIITLLSSVFNYLKLSPLKSIRLAYLFTLPIDWLLKQILVTLAQLKLQLTPHLLVIGITGSYGKTSTKELLAQLLQPDYRVLAPPGSWNTLTALSWLIITQLNRQHQIFIVEMGAYKKREIKRLCQLVKPRIGILTAIGPVHLERFESLEHIIQAKSELLEALPPDGLAVINGTNQHCVAAAQSTQAPVIWYGINRLSHQITSPFPQILATQLKIKPTAANFTIKISQSASKTKKTHLSAPILGRAVIHNLLPGVAVLYKLQCQLSLAKCQMFTHLPKQLSSLTPAPHRLQIIRQDHLMTIIDNSYSSNPAAAQNSLEVLQTFPGRKIVITPGFIELGTEQSQENQKFGQQLAKSVDYVFIVGETNKQSLLRGLKNGGLSSEHVFTVSDRDQAASQLSLVASPGSVVLFENDLPSTYL